MRRVKGPQCHVAVLSASMVKSSQRFSLFIRSGDRLYANPSEGRENDQVKTLGRGGDGIIF